MLARIDDLELLAHTVRGGAQSEVVENLADGEGVGEESDDAHPLAAAGADERVCLVDPAGVARSSGYRACPLRWS